MKKTLLLFAAFLASIGMNAQTLTVPDVEVRQGDKVSFELVVDVPANSYVGFQFETTFPTGLNYTGKTKVIADWDGSFSTSSVNYKGSSNSGTLTPIPAGEMVIATAEIEVDATKAVGEYDVTISNFEFLGYKGGAEDKKIADVTFKVIVSDRVILDENATAVPADATGVNVKVKRTINANEWSTICLPFAMDATQVKAAFGDDVKLGDFNGCEATYDTEENVEDLTIKFTSATAIEANHPYIIKVKSAIKAFTVDGVNIAVDEASVKKDEFRTGSGSKKDPYVYHYNSFVGTYEANTELAQAALFISKGQLWYSDGNTKMKGYRAYFDFYDVLKAAEDQMSSSSRIFISFDETTGVKTMKAVDNENYYDLQGRRVSEPTKKGLYIRGNKKVFIK